MTGKYQIPPRKRLLPYLAGVVAMAVVWLSMLNLADASGALSIYIGAIVGFNAYAFVAAGVAKPQEEEDEGFFLTPGPGGNPS